MEESGRVTRPSRGEKRKRHDRQAVAFFNESGKVRLFCAVKRIRCVSGLDDFQLVLD
jgi:hypothetical protein